MKKNTIQLKNLELIPLNVDPLENMLNLLGNDPKLRSNVKNNLNYLSNQHQSISVKRLRHIVLYTFLAFKLDLTNEEVLKKMDTYPTVKNRNLSYLVQIFHLLESNGYPKEQVCANSQISKKIRNFLIFINYF